MVSRCFYLFFTAGVRSPRVSKGQNPVRKQGPE